MLRFHLHESQWLICLDPTVAENFSPGSEDEGYSSSHFPVAGQRSPGDAMEWGEGMSSDLDCLMMHAYLPLNNQNRDDNEWIECLEFACYQTARERREQLHNSCERIVIAGLS